MIQVPRKLHADDWQVGKHPLHVTLDGQGYRQVREYDMDEGWIIVPAVNEDGRLIITGKGEIAERKLFGKVGVHAL